MLRDKEVGAILAWCLRGMTKAIIGPQELPCEGAKEEGGAEGRGRDRGGRKEEKRKEAEEERPGVGREGCPHWEEGPYVQDHTSSSWPS